MRECRGAEEGNEGILPDLTIFTDGSAIGNPGPAGWAYVRSDGEEDSGALGIAGNNVAELTAVWQALQSCPPGSYVQVVTDSRNVVGWLAEGWKRNDPPIRSVVHAIEEVIRDRHLQVTYQRIAGHSGSPENERVHKLAERAARSDTGLGL